MSSTPAFRGSPLSSSPSRHLEHTRALGNVTSVRVCIYLQHRVCVYACVWGGAFSEWVTRLLALDTALSRINVSAS